MRRVVEAAGVVMPATLDGEMAKFLRFCKNMPGAHICAQPWKAMDAI